MVADDLHVDSIGDDLSFLLEFVELALVVLGESELLGDENLLSSSELKFGSSEGFEGMVDVLGLNSDGHENGSNVDSSSFAQWLSKSSSHSSLESIGSST